MDLIVASTQGDVSVVNNDGVGKITSDKRKETLSDRIFGLLYRGDIINKDYRNCVSEIKTKVKNLLKGAELSEKTHEAVNNFLDKMNTKVNESGIFVFEIHDTIGYFVRDASQERCGNIDYFLSLIRGLVEYINNPPTQASTKEPLFKFRATIAIGDGFNNSNKACGTHLANIEVVSGGSKSRRRRRHRRKPARKTRRGRTRKSKAKTHRHRRHSRIRNHHKKYTSRRRR
jgi:hypothetical protein